MSAQHPQPTPAEMLMQLGFAHTGTRVLMTSLELDVYSPLADGARTAADVARAVGASERGVRMILDVLATFQLLSKTGDRYELTPPARELLLPSSPDFMGQTLGSAQAAASWDRLTEVVRSGIGVQQVETESLAEEFFPGLVRGARCPLPEGPGRCQGLGGGNQSQGDARRRRGLWYQRMGHRRRRGGPRSACHRPGDFPALFDLTRKYAERHGVADRYDYLPGDLKTVDFGEERFDLALLGNIVHSEGVESSRGLFRRLHAALKPAGRLVVVDMIPDDQRTGPPFPLLFALTMLLMTEKGGTYTFAEYRGWLEEAGFTNVETAEIGAALADRDRVEAVAAVLVWAG